MRKLLSTAAAIGIFVSTSISPVAFALDANALPVFDRTNAGNANVDVTTPADNKMNIKITGGDNAVGLANWNSFNIGSNATVNVEFGGRYQTSLNIVDAADGVSEIYGNFTNSGCYGCDYAQTGKVILLNPNGIAFGNGANVNLNSFTASTMSGTYDEATKTLTLTRNGASDQGIQVSNGAKIYGDKGVGFASDNIYLYKGSQIATNISEKNAVVLDEGGNEVDATLGKVKLITSDGVNFKYYNNQSFEAIEQVKSTPDKMTVYAAGDIVSGHIDIRNASTNSNSTLNANEAILKAYKAEVGNDGNIWLTSNSKVVAAQSDILTENLPGAENKPGGNIVITGKNKVVLNADVLEAVGDIIINAPKGDAGVENSKLTAKNVTIEADGVASAQIGTEIEADKVTIKGGDRAQVVISKIDANDEVTIDGKDVWFARADIDAGNETKPGKIDVNAQDNVLVNNGTTKLQTRENGEINITAGKDVTTANGSSLDLNNKKTNINADGNINVNLDNAGGNVKANAQDTIEINSNGTLAVEKLNANRSIIIVSDDIVFNNGDLKAEDLVSVTARRDNITSTGNAAKLNSNVVELNAAGDITGNYNLEKDENFTAETQINSMIAGGNINVNLEKADNTNAGLVAEAGRNLSVNTGAETLAISRLVAKNGDLTVTANDVIIGKKINNFSNVGNEAKFGNDNLNRGFLYVRNGNFNSNVASGGHDPEPNYNTEASGGTAYIGENNEIQYTKHYINYNDADAKRFFLVHIPTGVVTEADLAASNAQPTSLTRLQDSQSSQLNKMPRRNEVFNGNTNILDQRTAFVDVYAAASQIEIEEDEEY